MKDKAEAMVMASFAGDSLALGAHWIYDVDEIERKMGRVSTLLKPLPESYHPTKSAGDFTHYGDQTLVLLESVAESGRFSQDDFGARWRQLFSGYHGYVDHATKGTLEGFEAGKGPAEAGSHSADLSGAARICALVYRYRFDPETLSSAAKAQTAMTHNNPMVVHSADFLARVAQAVLGGVSPVDAMKRVADEHFKSEFIATAVHEGLESLSLPAREAVLEFGQSCNVKGALPAVVYLVARYEADLKEALVENTMAGGDSAARGMAVGLILGAHLGMGAIPAEWISGMRAAQRIRELLARIDASL